MDSLMAVELATSIEARARHSIVGARTQRRSDHRQRRRTHRRLLHPVEDAAAACRRRRGARGAGARRRRTASLADFGVENAAEFGAEIATPPPPRRSRSPPGSARERPAQSAAWPHGAAQGAAHPGSLAAAYAQDRTRTQRAGAGARSRATARSAHTDSIPDSWCRFDLHPDYQQLRILQRGGGETRRRQSLFPRA